MGGDIRYSVKKGFFGVLLVIVQCSVCAWTFASDYQKTVLDNGAVVVAQEVRESPLVTIWIRVMSGLSNEGEYAASGISHFLEHLLFKGTYDLDSKEIRKAVKLMGGMINGSTGMDSAEYHITVPKENFEAALDLLGSMVFEAVFTDEGMESERRVVLKEIRLRNDDPIEKRMRRLFLKAYDKHVYKYPVIGNEELLERLTREDILRYHAAVYTPEKMVVGVVGGIPADTAINAAKKKFKKYAKGKPWDVTLFAETEQKKEKREKFFDDVTLGYLAIGFHTTSLYSRDLYPGDVISILLGEGNDSRFYKRLVKDKQFLYTVSAGNYTPRYPGLFITTGVGTPSKLEEARSEIFFIIEELKNEGVEDAEIERAKNIVISRYLHSHERISSIAASMTNSEMLMGDPGFFEKYVEKIKAVTKEDVKKFAEKYLNVRNSTTVFLLPPDHAEETVPAVLPDEKGEVGETRNSKAESRNLKTENRNSKLESRNSDKTRDIRTSGSVKVTEVEAETVPGEVRGLSQGERDKKNETKIITLKNGLRIVVKERGCLPLVAVTFTVPGGLIVEEEVNNGISNIMTGVLLKGTKERKEGEIVPVIEKNGGTIGTFSGMNSMGVTLDLLKKNLKEGMDIFEDVIKNASFPEKEIVKDRKKIIAGIREEEKDIFENGMIHLGRLLYGEHPYGMRISGEIRTVELISREDMVAFYHKHFVPAGAVITVVGDVDAGKIITDITDRFAEWEGKPFAVKKKDPVPLDGMISEDLTMKKEQALFILAFQGIRITDRRRYTLAIISSLLSGSDGLLFYMVREQKGLAYTSNAVSASGVDPGYFLLYAATTENNIGKIKDIIVDAINTIKEGNFSEDEIIASKNKLISRHANALEANCSIAMTMGLDELYDLGYENYKQYSAKISAVTKEEIVKFANEILDLDHCAIVTVHSKR